MAKGNIGNLLQHFVGLSCAASLVKMGAGRAIEYIDCYSMGTWEAIEGGNPQGFVSKVKRFQEMRAAGDFVASTFWAAWVSHYGKADIPAHPQEREYPNTAVLLRTAFPAQPWNMRLHDAIEEKRKSLEDWSRKQSPGSYRVGGDWTQSSLILKTPLPKDTAAMVMLDPYQIVEDGVPNDGQGGYLSKQLLRYLFGPLALDAHKRDKSVGACAILLFSYSDANPETPNQVVRDAFSEDKWAVERVQSGPWNVNGRRRWHQGWVVTIGVESPLVLPSLQEAWDRWAQ